MKNLLCIIGRTASGKDTVAKYLRNERGLKQVVSYTNRPKRDDETDGVEHYFVSDEQFKQIMKEDEIAAYTKIEDKKTGVKGYEYCATVGEVLNSDVYVIDPNGIESLKEEFKNIDIDINFIYIYIFCDKDEREERVKASNRGSGALAAFKERDDNEDAQFSLYERKHLGSRENNRYWIDNRKSKEELLIKVDHVLAKIKEDHK